PGSPAEKALKERRKRRGKPINELTLPGVATAEEIEAEVEAPVSGQRQQPKSKKRAKKGKGGR
ncbi:MAG: membrane protein insertase YidC, partial [Tetrasphaera sp.]|nr:membrane protein insertase YidC [Tetrasphaera sp.]